MNSQQVPKQEFQPTSSCPGLDYIDISAPPTDMRYNQDASTTSLALEAPTHQPSPVINLFPPPGLNTNTAYPTEGGPFYHPGHSIFPSLDVRPRLGSSTSSTGMAHRPATIPLSQQISARDQYSPATPSFRRPSEHPTRSPSFPGTPSRRHPLSPTPSPIAGFSTPVAMDGSYPARSQGQATNPPLDPVVTLGILHYADGTPSSGVRPEINGTIDKGFFLSDGEWTCYRRNYFSCICSFSLSPHYPNMPLQLTLSSSQQTYTVQAFAMSISAVVSENDSHNIELIQHTPKRDKGPVMKPEKVRMVPKVPQAPHHSLYHGHGDPGLTARGVYDPTYGGAAASQGGGAFQTEHTFERIQFKQATANNGKRRAAQQYYHLVVELYAEVGPQGPDQFVRVAYRRSAKMIVRGRSPGHYQTERRGSTSSGPGGGGGSLGGYGNGPMIGADFAPGGPMLGGGFTTGYEGRGPAMPPYGGRHHQHDLPPEALGPSEDPKAIETTKGYQYSPAMIYEGQHDSRGGVVIYTHQQDDHESRAKYGYEGANDTLPSILNPGPLMANRRCRPSEIKQRSDGYYPTLASQMGINIAN